MIVWRGFGALALLFALAAGLLTGAGMSPFLPQEYIPFSVAVGMLLAGIACWFTGQALNVNGPNKKIAAWQEQRRGQLDQLVNDGTFSLGPGQPVPQSKEEARQWADAIFAKETEALKKLRNQHTMFWIPLQYWAFILAGVGVAAAVAGATAL